MTPRHMALAAGTRLGSYEIVAPLGAGGMGEVYRARDTKLGRHVALKLLAEEAAADPERLERFDREARTLAGLDHPSIVTIHAVEEAAGHQFIAMTLVEGRTLADVMPASGFPLERLLTIAVQVADAVAAAHQHGIVHRDLKPANIMVGAHDRVTVLDFGLAKLREAAPVADVTMPPTREVTGEGRILGTVAYMSPEQAEGKQVDARSDVFSLGIVLYEMATGERPFHGDTSMSVLSAILKDSPKSLSDVKPQLPRDLARIIRRCLAKEPDRRYQSAIDLRNDVEDLRQSALKGELETAGITAAATRSTTRLWPMATAASIVVALAAIGWSLLRAPAAADATPPAMRFSRLTMLEGVTVDPVISPDGKWVAYASLVSGNSEIYLQSATGQAAINLTKNNANDSNPAFSPDGETIAFRSTRDGGGLFEMGRTGESVKRLAPNGFTPSWFPDGKRIVYATQTTAVVDSRGGGASELWVVDSNGGESRRLFAGDAMQPRVSPHGLRIAFWAIHYDLTTNRVVNSNRDLWTIAADGTNPVRITDEASTEWNPVWSPDGRWLYFLSNRSGSMNLWRIGIDEASGVVHGAPEPLSAPASYVRNFTLSADGRAAAYATATLASGLSRVRFNLQTATTEGAVQHITTGSRDFGGVEVSPNGQQVLVASSPFQQEDLYLLAPDGTGFMSLTNDPGRDRGPHFSPDGRRIFFYTDHEGAYDVWSINTDGSGRRRLTTTDGRYFPVPSPDGARLLVADINNYGLFVIDANDPSKPAEVLPPFPATLRGPNFVPQDWSPDGKTIIGASGAHVWTYSFETKEHREVTTNGGSFQWFADSRRFLATRQGRVIVVDSATGQSREVFAMSGEGINSAQFSSDGWLYFISGNLTGDVWVVRFGDTKPDAARTQP
jgi:Tol biopolymer transport system component